MSSEIKVDTISEKTPANGVTIDGVNLKDSVVKTDTINEKTSTAGVTIDGVLLKDNFGGNIATQQWRITANVTSTGDLTSNWEAPDTENQTGGNGSFVSESSGIFSFSSTGFYLVLFNFSHQVTSATNTYGIAEIKATDDNATYSAVAQTYFGGTSDYDTGVGVLSTLLDVTNTTNDKVKFTFTDQTGSPRLQGSTSENKTSAIFIKLGET
jgi:hypothetical protein